MTQTHTALFANYGSCPVGVICWWDLDADCDVDNDDLTTLFANWGDCGQPLNGGGNLEPEYIQMWLDAGGLEGLLSGTIDPADVAAAMDQPTPEQQWVALFELID